MTKAVIESNGVTDVFEEEVSMSVLDVIQILLEHLPDSDHSEDKTWTYCWEELSCEAQEAVIEARKKAITFLREGEEEPVKSEEVSHNGKV